jgi:hypothetical protein
VSSPEEHDRKQQPPYLDPALVIDTRIGKIEREQAEERRQQQEYNRKQLRFNGLLVLFTFLLFLTSVASDILTLRYVAIAKQSADSAREAVAAAHDTLTSGNQAFAQTLAEMKAQSAAAQGAATTAEGTLKQTRNALMIEQRPYLIAEAPSFVGQAINPGQEVTASVAVKNIGKTPAIRVLTDIKILKFRATTQPDYVKFIESAFAGLRRERAKLRSAIADPKIAKLTPGYDIAPTGTSFSETFPGVVLSAEEIASMLDGKNRGLDDTSTSLYVVGVAGYTDTFSQSYDVEFCWFYMGPNIKTWHICDSHNRIR